MGRGAASIALAGPGAPGSHAGLETRLFLGHQAASDLNQALEAGPGGQSEAEKHSPLQSGALIIHPLPELGREKKKTTHTEFFNLLSFHMSQGGLPV